MEDLIELQQKNKELLADYNELFSRFFIAEKGFKETNAALKDLVDTVIGIKKVYLSENQINELKKAKTILKKWNT